MSNTGLIVLSTVLACCLIIAVVAAMLLEAKVERLEIQNNELKNRIKRLKRYGVHDLAEKRK